MNKLTVRELINILSTRDQDSIPTFLLNSLSDGWKEVEMDYDMIKRGGENGKGVAFEIDESEMPLGDN